MGFLKEEGIQSQKKELSIGVVVIGVFVTVVSAIVWLVLKAVTGLRPSEEEEMTGLDVSELGMEAYPEFRN